MRGFATEKLFVQSGNMTVCLLSSKFAFFPFLFIHIIIKLPLIPSAPQQTLSYHSGRTACWKARGKVLWQSPQGGPFEQPLQRAEASQSSQWRSAFSPSSLSSCYRLSPGGEWAQHQWSSKLEQSRCPLQWGPWEATHWFLTSNLSTYLPLSKGQKFEQSVVRYTSRRVNLLTIFHLWLTSARFPNLVMKGWDRFTHT